MKKTEGGKKKLFSQSERNKERVAKPRSKSFQQSKRNKPPVVKINLFKEKLDDDNTYNNTNIIRSIENNEMGNTDINFKRFTKKVVVLKKNPYLKTDQHFYKAKDDLNNILKKDKPIQNVFYNTFYNCSFDHNLTNNNIKIKKNPLHTSSNNFYPKIYINKINSKINRTNISFSKDNKNSINDKAYSTEKNFYKNKLNSKSYSHFNDIKSDKGHKVHRYIYVNEKNKANSYAQNFMNSLKKNSKSQVFDEFASL